MVYQVEVLCKEIFENIIIVMYDVVGFFEIEFYVLINLVVLFVENILYECLMVLMKLELVEVYDDVLVVLQQKGWIEYFEQIVVFKVSLVIQQVLLYWNRGKLEKICEILIYFLIDSFDYDIIYLNNYSQVGIIVYYVGSVVKVISRVFCDLVILFECIGNYYREVGNYERVL